MLEDTIIAISTPPGTGGLGIIRLSGPDALAVAGQIFQAKNIDGRDFPVRKLVLGELVDRQSGGVLDECFLVSFESPNSYTREDMIELTCHGSPVLLEEIVRLGIRAGARPAGPGEFTLRAYLNGRLDIIQAEAVNDLIRSVTLTQAKASVRQILGGVSSKLGSIREELIRLAADIESGLEFPEEGLGLEANEQLQALEKILSGVNKLIASYEAGRALGEGLTVAIIGRKNVGKSTIFNALLEHERAIVTPFPGTTRDFIKEHLIINGYVFHLIDMAGLGEPGDPAERIGIKKSWGIAEEAEGLILVMDISTGLSKDDEMLIEKFRQRKPIVVLNKIDLPGKIDRDMIKGMVPGGRVVEISALLGTNIDHLKSNMFEAFGPRQDLEDDVILHAHQRNKLIEIKDALEKACLILTSGHSEEMGAEEIRGALKIMGELTGEISTEDVINDIFSRFCVGK